MKLKIKKTSTDSPPPPGIGTILHVAGHYISFQQSPMRHGCEICTVKTPTGTLSVNTTVINEGGWSSPNNCSLILQWTSSVNSLSAPDRLLLHKSFQISSLPIFIDFLPALESLKPTTSGAVDSHDFFIVPKGCNVCRADDCNTRWRKSS